MTIMLSVEKNKNSFSEIAQRAALRKADPSLRHIPNTYDIRVASENAKLMIYHQYQSINTDEGDIV